jgi:FdhD protein
VTAPRPGSGAAGRRRGAQVRRPVRSVSLGEDGTRVRDRRDSLATEEPLEIRARAPGGPAVPVSVTMRTPGSDFDLAAGFLFGESLIRDPADLDAIRYCVEEAGAAQQYNVVTVELAPGAAFDPESLRRHFYTTSSCGVCGKASIEAVLGPVPAAPVDSLRVTPELLLSLPERLRERQSLFERTGGLHAAASFDGAGALLDAREDVGRHNAMDKLVGAALLRGELPLAGRLILVSGRLSFELVQKAARAGAELLAGVSAPSSLAVELAEAAGVTLVGFLRGSGFNVYSAPHRILSS